MPTQRKRRNGLWKYSFALVLGLKLDATEKSALAAFMRQL